MNFRISSEASEDLVSVWKYTREHWGVEQADLYIDAIMLRLIWLIGNRKLWRPRPEIKEGVFSCTEKSHVIFFSADEEYINILRILHGRLDLGHQLK